MKKMVVTVSFVLLLFVACLINARFNNDNREAKILGEAAYVSSDTQVSEDIFYEQRAERDKVRSDACDLLREVTENPGTTAEGRAQAEQQLINIAKHMESEVSCEGILKSRGFSDVLLTVSDEGVTVSVSETDLLPAQIAQIKDAVVSCTGADADKIKIIPAA